MAKAADQMSGHSDSIAEVFSKANSAMDPAFPYISSRRFPSTCAKDIQEEDIMNMLLDMKEEQNRQQEAEDKLEKELKFGLPENPASYTSSHTKVWINQALVTIGIPEERAAEIVSKLDSPDIPNITGASVSRWSWEQWQHVFGIHGDILQRKFNFWIDDFKRNNPSDLKPPQDVLPMSPLPTCTEQEKRTLQEMGMDKNQLQEFFRCPDELEHRYPVSKHDYFDQMVSSPTHQHDQSATFKPYLPYHTIYPPTPFDPDYNMYSNPSLYPSISKVKIDPVDSWIPRSPDSLGSAGDYSAGDSDEGAELQPPQYHSHHHPNRRLPSFAIFQHHTALPSASCTEDPIPMAVTMTKTKRGRPRKERPPTQKNKQPILYKFILEHLEDPRSRRYVEWVRKSDGVFKFHSAQKDAFAQLWGECKAKGGSREPMTYQNMARALRNYTIGKNGKRNIMERVKKRLHYKFVPGVLLAGVM